MSAADPLTKFMISKGVPYEPCVLHPQDTVIFSFPKKAPEKSVVREDITALTQLELWLKYQAFFCEHKPSITVNVREHEWPTVGAFVWNNFYTLSGVSFLPENTGTYKQAPYEAITEEEYNKLYAESIKEINWEEMKEYEDNVEGIQTLSCSAGSCEI